MTACQVQKYLQTRDNAFTPKAVNNAAKHIRHISKPLMKTIDLYRNMNKHGDVTVLQLCQSFSIIYENQLGNQPRVGANCYVKTIHSEWHNFRVVWGM